MWTWERETATENTGWLEDIDDKDEPCVRGYGHITQTITAHKYITDK